MIHVFYASVAVVCAALLGLGLGLFVGFRFGKWTFRHTIEALMESKAMAGPLAVGWAYGQVHDRLQQGADAAGIRAFLAEERERLSALAHDFGDDELGPRLTAEIERKLDEDQSGDDPP